MERRRNTAFASARGRYTRNAKAEAEYHELEAALDQMAKRDQRLFELSFHVLLGADELVHLDEITRTTVQSVSSATRIHLQTATYAQLHGWLGMMPGAGHNAPHKRVGLRADLQLGPGRGAAALRPVPPLGRAVPPRHREPAED